MEIDPLGEMGLELVMRSLLLLMTSPALQKAIKRTHDSWLFSPVLIITTGFLWGLKNQRTLGGKKKKRPDQSKSYLSWVFEEFFFSLVLMITPGFLRGLKNQGTLGKKKTETGSIIPFLGLLVYSFGGSLLIFILNLALIVNPGFLLVGWLAGWLVWKKILIF